MMRTSKALGVAAAALAAFVLLVLGRDAGRIPETAQPAVADRVVVAAPLQIVLAGSDRFLAANLEAIRVMATADDDPAAAVATASYRIRAHQVVAQLNPCHEDNYYVANAMLTWGGAASEGLDVLRRATACRFWDEFPPFFLGFNEWFFNRDAAQARHYLELAAERSTSNAVAMRRIGIMIEAGEFADASAASAFLQQEHDQAGDEKLRESLQRRIERLQGLMALREAQQRYEARFGPLQAPAALIEQGILAAFPEDPMRLGYAFVDGRFRLRELKVPGLENRP